MSESHESVGSERQKDAVAARRGMTVEEFKKWMAAERRKQTAELKKKGLR